MLSLFASEFGCYCQYDLFGNEVSYFQLGPDDYPSDAQRMDWIAHLINQEKYEDKILVAHDIHTKHRLELFGGHGFAHILQNVVPKLTGQKGVSQEVIDKILVKNPATVLQMPN